MKSNLNICENTSETVKNDFPEKSEYKQEKESCSLDIILRTCDVANVHSDWRVRYHEIEKSHLVVGCLNSLAKSIDSVSNVNISLTVLDDHSSEETLIKIENILKKLNNTRLIRLDDKGYNNSAYQQWLMCRDSAADLVYSVEDDYLHCPTAIQEMVDSFYLFCDRLKRNDVVLYPFDEPSEYNPPSRTDFIVHGSARHWRTGIFTTNVMMTRPQLFRDNWELFKTLALKYNGDYLNPRTEHYEESNTIWKIWQNNQAIRFNPIPSLALHMQFEQQKDPFIDWQTWWKECTN
jgi:glycosyltransferase involved in cell wall biosynthesis